jgi:undecaprenyl-diphosphatase
MVSDETHPTAVYVTRSPADVLRLVVALAALVVLLLLEWLFGDTLVGFASDLLRGLDALPHWIVETLSIAIRLLAALVLIAGLLFTVVRSGWRMLLTIVVAVAIACALVAIFANLSDTRGGSTVVEASSGLGPLTDAGFPSTFGIAALAAALTAGAPWLSRRWRRWGWVAVLGLVFTRFFTAAISFDSFRAALIGWVAGAGALVLLGAPSRRPTAAAIKDALTAVGLPLEQLDAASVDARGSTPYFGAGPDGSRYFVKVLGEDQRSADLLFRLYRWIQRRDLGDERPFSSLRRAVEHEAFVSLAARDLGVRTPRVRAVASVEPNGFVLAYDAVEGRSLDRLQPAEITDGVLDLIWAQVGKLRAHRIAHRDLRLANVFLGADGEAWMIDFGFSELAASDLLLANDVMELVASSSAVVGPERAAVHARASVDPATMAAARDRLHPWAMSGATRTAMKSNPGLMDELRQRLDGS